MAERRNERTLQPPRLSGVFPKADPGSCERPGTVADRSGRLHPYRRIRPCPTSPNACPAGCSGGFVLLSSVQLPMKSSPCHPESGVARPAVSPQRLSIAEVDTPKSVKTPCRFPRFWSLLMPMVLP